MPPNSALSTDAFSSLHRAYSGKTRTSGPFKPVRLLATVAFLLAPLTAAAACLAYEREATLTGMLRYETKPAGDRAERVPILELNAPVCIEGQGSDRIHVRREGVTSVQLAFAPEVLTKVPENRTVTAVGTLSGRVTGNPRIPVLLRVKAWR